MLKILRAYSYLNIFVKFPNYKKAHFGLKIIKVHDYPKEHFLSQLSVLKFKSMANMMCVAMEQKDQPLIVVLKNVIL